SELNQVDITYVRDGIPELVIADPGLVSDQSERLRLYEAKLKAYARYMSMDEFREEFENHDEAIITLVSVSPPSPEMKAISIQLENPDGTTRLVPIEFRQQDRVI
ncbi:MAG: hypothetical protein AAF497_24790, partial [Planctomycetota bacterium]